MSQAAVWVNNRTLRVRTRQIKHKKLPRIPIFDLIWSIKPKLMNRDTSSSRHKQRCILSMFYLNCKSVTSAVSEILAYQKIYSAPAQTIVEKINGLSGHIMLSDPPPPLSQCWLLKLPDSAKKTTLTQGGGEKSHLSQWVLIFSMIVWVREFLAIYCM